MLDVSVPRNFAKDQPMKGMRKRVNRWRLAKRDVSGFVPFRISKTIRRRCHASMRAGRIDRARGGGERGFSMQLPPPGGILGGRRDSSTRGDRSLERTGDGY